MKISIVGSGYVGLSLSVLLSQMHDVTVLDISEEKVDLINKKKSPIKDRQLENYLQNKDLNLKATLDNSMAYKKANYIIIATPTNYDLNLGSFDTSIVEQVISDCVKINGNATIVIKSTVPLGFTDRMRTKFNKKDIFFSPEFLRESKALYDNLYPSRIVVGDVTEKANLFAKILIDCSNKNEADVPLLTMESTEAEAVKLFSNTYLAMRVAFFNELDSFNEIKNLSSEKIIKGVSSDPRIGNHYNNPSFGYGGYCLPKDTKQLLENYENVPNEIIKSVVKSNLTRKDFIVDSIVKRIPKIVGVYRLIMKEGADNFRESAIIDIIKKLKIKKIKLILYEPFINDHEFEGIIIEKNLEKFIAKSDLIIANRLSSKLEHVKNKVYSRDLYGEN